MGEGSQSAESGDSTEPHPRAHPAGPTVRSPANHMWTVSAVVIEGDDLEPRHGVVSAADLGDAAEQLCEYLPETDPDDGDYYLVAREVPLLAGGRRGGGQHPRRTWVSPIRRDDDTGRTTYGGWTVADDHPRFHGTGYLN
ncbi:hypothetical protein [Nocardia bovistercoris]|uniref:Uncharacterized protein n=1 Tax=Nocardia bovistercoris TaxID=2785916 RepID=A0A931IB16_9NOCA|nr:hypothetical protein [Nocardia bovistercoris]MBH0776912.1 hypothetical protein [Nocardia bovistercoris]